MWDSSFVHYMTLDIILFLKAHKLHKIPQKKPFLYYRPSLENAIFKYQAIPMLKAQRPKPLACQDHNDSAINDKNLMAGYFPRVTCTNQECLFCSFSFTRKNFSQYNLGRRIPWANLGKWQ